MRLLLLLLLSSPIRLHAKAAKDWANVDYDSLEREWEEGDEEAELITDDELLYRETERRREEGIEISDQMDASAVRHQQSMSGPAMMFVELKPAKPDGSAFGEEDYKWLAGSWREVGVCVCTCPALPPRHFTPPLSLSAHVHGRAGGAGV